MSEPNDKPTPEAGDEEGPMIEEIFSESIDHEGLHADVLLPADGSKPPNTQNDTE